MAIKKVTYFETSNGLTFQCEQKAIEAEKTYQIKQAMFSFLDSADFTEKDCSKISTLIAENREGILKILLQQ